LERFLRQLRKAQGECDKLNSGSGNGGVGASGSSSFDVREAVRTKFQSQQRVDAAPALDMM
jgi:hypothetical protein